MTREELRKFEPLWDKWYIQEYLGGGSYGDVYRITCQVYESSYEAALKVISIPKDRSELTEVEMNCETREDTIEYFDQLRQNITAEIDMMEQLKGRTNIVSFEDHNIIPHNNGKDPGYDIFIRMELLEDISSVIAKEFRQWADNSQVVKIGRDIAEGLRICHTHNILHRDIKLGNIFRSKDGDYKIGDFGIARSVSDSDLTMSVKGTFNYMAPEVYNREHYDFRADIYSLGMVLYYLLNKNRGPFLPLNDVPTAEQKDMALIRRMRGDDLPAPIMAKEKLAQIILKACNYNKENRFSSMEEFARALLLLESEDMQRPDDVLGKTSQIPDNKEDDDDRTVYLSQPVTDATEADDLTVAYIEPDVGSVSQCVPVTDLPINIKEEEPDEDDRTVAMVSSEFVGTISAEPQAANVEKPVVQNDTYKPVPDVPNRKSKKFIVIGAAAAVICAIGITAGIAVTSKRAAAVVAEEEQAQIVPEEESGLQRTEDVLEEPAVEEIPEEEKGPVEPFCNKEVLAINKKNDNKLVFEGDAFADITLKGTFQVSKEDATKVDGKLAIKDAPETIEESGDYIWIFTPEDEGAYQIVTGTVHITAVHNEYVTGVDEVKSIKDKAALYKVDLTNCGLKDLSILDGAVNLAVVELDNNQLKKIDVLAQCENLQQVYLSGNSDLSDIKPLLGLKHLMIYEAANTAVSEEDIAKLDKIVQK